MKISAKKFLKDVRELGHTATLSPDKTFVIFSPPLPTNLIQTAIDITDDLCIILDNELLFLSNEDEALIDSLVDNDEDSLHSTFNLITNQTEYKQEESPSLPVVYEELTAESFDRDFDYIRKNLKDVIASGTTALNRMIMVADASAHPRAYEVVATLIKALADVNKDLLDSHKKRIETSQMNGTVNNNNSNTTNVQNNVIFSGSTSELAKLLKGK